jgi:hypothetical protein
MLVMIAAGFWHHVKEDRVADMLGKQEVRRLNKWRGHIGRRLLRLMDWQDIFSEWNYICSGRSNENRVSVTVFGRCSATEVRLYHEC